MIYYKNCFCYFFVLCLVSAISKSLYVLLNLVDSFNLADGQSRSLDNLSILSTPRHHALLDHSSQEMLFNYRPRSSFTRLLDDDPDVRTYDADVTSHVGPFLADTPDGDVISDSSMQESNAINARLVEQQHNKSTAWSTVLNRGRVIRLSAGRLSLRFARSLIAVFSSQRCIICCWALVLAVGMVVAIVVAVALCVLESDIDIPLINEIRRLPEVDRFKNEEYETMKRSILGNDEDP